MKRILCAIVACVLCASVAITASGCGCEKKKSKNSTSSTSGPGYEVPTTAFDFEAGDFGFYKLNDKEVKVTVYKGKDKNITIPDTVNGASVSVIGHSLFANSNIESVSIPATTTEIQDYAFSSCQNLKSVEIPEGVKVIGQNAFWNCRNLTTVKLPSSLKTIDWYAFSATGIASIEIPQSDTLQKLSEKVFFQCPNLSEVTLPVTITSIADDTFEQCAAGLKIKAYVGSYGVSFAKSHGYEVEELAR